MRCQNGQTYRVYSSLSKKNSELTYAIPFFRKAFLQVDYFFLTNARKHFLSHFVQFSYFFFQFSSICHQSAEFWELLCGHFNGMLSETRVPCPQSLQRLVHQRFLSGSLCVAFES